MANLEPREVTFLCSRLEAERQGYNLARCGNIGALVIEQSESAAAQTQMAAFEPLDEALLPKDQQQAVDKAVSIFSELIKGESQESAARNLSMGTRTLKRHIEEARHALGGCGLGQMTRHLIELGKLDKPEPESPVPDLVIPGKALSAAQFLVASLSSRGWSMTSMQRAFGKNYSWKDFLDHVGNRAGATTVPSITWRLFSRGLLVPDAALHREWQGATTMPVAVGVE